MVADNRYNLEEIVPPYLKYTYFKDAHLDSLRFRPEAKGFDMVNAWWLIESSILSYSNKESVTKEFQRVNLLEVQPFSGKSTQCYVAGNADFLIVVFRGTEIWARPGETNPLKIIGPILADIMADLDIGLDDCAQGGRVHRGFKKALDEVWEGEKGLFAYLQSREGNGRTLWFTGHSLGAALATLAWKRYRGHGHAPGLYTFGSPRVGDREFGQGFQETYRFVNNNDFVTMVPPPIDYRHLGTLKHLNAEGCIDSSPPRAVAGQDVSQPVSFPFWKEIHALSANLQQAISKIVPFLPFREGISLSPADFIPGAILDHVPTLYARYIKKNILAENNR